MQKMLRVESFPDLRKDVSNGGVVNSNKDSYDTYVQQKNKILKDKVEKEAMANEINNMKRDISDIKSMLTLLLDRQ